jgi:ribosomal protein L11 methyltransferase
VHPGLASGTGYSTPTQLCLQAIERADLSGLVLDVGTGSGILARAARLLGAETVVGCDIDFDALAEARQHIDVFAGSVRSLRSECAGLIIANLNYWGLATLASDIARAATPGGRLIAGGFHTRRRAAVEALLARFGFRTIEAFEREDWVCLYGARPITPGAA